MSDKPISVNIEEKKKGTYAIIAGVLLLVSGAQYTIRNFAKLMITAIEYDIISRDLAIHLAKFIPIIGIINGFLVILGGLIYFFKGKKFYASLIIGFGSGASVFNLILTMVTTGPLFKYALIKSQFENMVHLGGNYILAFLGVTFAYMALIPDFQGFLLSFLAGTFLNMSGSLFEAQLITKALAIFGLINPSPLAIMIVGLLTVTGLFIFISALLYGYKRYMLGLAFVILGIFLAFPPFIILILETMFLMFSIVNYIRIILAILGFSFAIMALIHGAFNVFKGAVKGAVGKAVDKVKDFE
ncbi:MAG: hypothetical protein ACP6IP_10565 [Candidatus Njordarchaeia archaeon]